MKRRTAYAFFLSHCGYSYDPKTERPIDGRRRAAKALADAEKHGTALGLQAFWTEDPDPDRSFLDQDTYDDGDRESARFWGCRVFDADGRELASLWGIQEDVRLDTFQDDQRLFRAELFLEALATLQKEGGA